MRRFDKKKNMNKANLLAEQRHLQTKGLVKESFRDVDETPIGVDHNHTPIKSENEFIPGVSDSDYGLTVNMIATRIENGDEIYKTILHNPDVVKVINKLDNPEIINMINVLKNHPKELNKLINSI
jgi:hypothetical protein